MYVLWCANEVGSPAIPPQGTVTGICCFALEWASLQSGREPPTYMNIQRVWLKIAHKKQFCALKAGFDKTH